MEIEYSFLLVTNIIHQISTLFVWALEQNVLALILGVIVAIIAVWKYKSKNKLELRSDKKQHTQDIQKIYHMVAQIGIRESNEKFIFTFPPNYRPSVDYDYLEQSINGNLDLSSEPIDEKYLYQCEDYKHYDNALKHLKHRKYSDIYKHWKTMNDLCDNLNKKPLFRTKLKDVINKKMQEQLPEIHYGYMSKPNYCYPNSIYDFIYNSFTKYENSSDAPSLELVNITGQNEKVIRAIDCSKIHIIIDGTNNTYFERYKKIYNDVLNDSNLRNYRNNELNIRQKINPEQEKFTEKIKDLAKRLDTGEVIKGKCNGCPII